MQHCIKRALHAVYRPYSLKLTKFEYFSQTHQIRIHLSNSPKIRIRRMKTATIFTTLTCCLLAAMCSCNALFCSTCVLEQCPEANDCPAGKVMDSCGCCEVCAIPLGGACHTVEDLGLCADGKFCLPDGGLFSGAISGKCLGEHCKRIKYYCVPKFFATAIIIILYLFIFVDITECFSSGCDVIDDSCDCAYSNSCPTKNFAFGDLLSCEISLLENSTETEGTN